MHTMSFQHKQAMLHIRIAAEHSRTRASVAARRRPQRQGRAFALGMWKILRAEES
jgi:hypothetical protein